MPFISRIDTQINTPATPELLQLSRWGSNDASTPELGNSPSSLYSLHSPGTPVSPTTPPKDNWKLFSHGDNKLLDTPIVRATSTRSNRSISLSRHSSLNRNIPTKVGNLTIGRQIGIGSFSRIYEGYGKEGIFAIKTRLSSTPEDVFTHEQSVLMRLHALTNNNDNVVQYYKDLSNSDHIVLKMYDTSLDSLVRSPKYMSSNSMDFYDYRVMSQPLVGMHDWINWARQLVNGLKSIHSCNIVHADLKPDNILIKDGQLAISDFSGSIDLDLQSVSIVRDNYDEGIAWSPVFTDPEVRNGTKPSFGSDIYALGLVLAFCATGKEPFSTARNATQRLLWMDKMDPMESFEVDVQQRLTKVRPVISLLLKRSWDGVDEALSNLAASL